MDIKKLAVSDDLPQGKVTEGTPQKGDLPAGKVTDGVPQKGDLPAGKVTDGVPQKDDRPSGKIAAINPDELNSLFQEELQADGEPDTDEDESAKMVVSPEAKCAAINPDELNSLFEDELQATKTLSADAPDDIETALESPDDLNNLFQDELQTASNFNDDEEDDDPLDDKGPNPWVPLLKTLTTIEDVGEFVAYLKGLALDKTNLKKLVMYRDKHPIIPKMLQYALSKMGVKDLPLASADPNDLNALFQDELQTAKTAADSLEKNVMAEISDLFFKKGIKTKDKIISELMEIFPKLDYKFASDLYDDWSSDSAKASVKASTKEAVGNPFQDKTIVMIGRPPAPWSTKKFQDKLQNFGATVQISFSKDTEVALYNPLRIKGPKLQQVLSAGISVIPYENAIAIIEEGKVGHRLKNKVIVMTGKPPMGWTKGELSHWLKKEFTAVPEPSFTKRTEIVVYNKEQTDTAKLNKAISAGLEVLSYDELLGMLGLAGMKSKI